MDIEHVLRILNEAVEADPEAMNALFSYKRNVNKVLANHPTIEVGYDGQHTISAMGLINGLIRDKDNLLGTSICSVWDDWGRLIGFKRYDPETAGGTYLGGVV